MHDALEHPVDLVPGTLLRDILSPDIASVTPATSMRAAMERMRAERISSLVVLTRSRPVGILTERGIIAARAAAGPSLGRLKVRQVMTSPVFTVPQDLPVHQAFASFTRQAIRHLVVVDARGRAVGMVTQTNLVRNMGVEYFVEVKRVGQLMSRQLGAMDPGASLEEALSFMARGPYSCVIAVEHDVPVGILSERDMMALLATGQDFTSTCLDQVMTRPVLCVGRDLPVHQAAALMGEKGVRRLVVVDDAGKACGVMTQSDIVKGMEARYVQALHDLIRDKDSKLRQAEDDSARKGAYLDAILNSSVDLGIVATEGDTIAYVNKAALDLFGIPGPGPLGHSLVELHSRLKVSAARVRRALAAARKGRQHWFSVRLSLPSGARYVEGRISMIRSGDNALTAPTPSASSGYLLTLRDVTDRHTAEETIRRMAYHDALTGLPNRFLVLDRLELGLAQARRRGSLLAVMLLDLDGFKGINDTLGHSVGDLLLKSVGGRLEALLRKSDTVGRMGGDEFLVVLPDVKTPEGAAAVAEKMLDAVRRAHHVAGRDLTITTSIGLAFYPWDGQGAEVLIQHADMAMYRAKESGRDTYRFARDDMDHRPDAERPTVV